MSRRCDHGEHAGHAARSGGGGPTGAARQPGPSARSARQARRGPGADRHSRLFRAPRGLGAAAAALKSEIAERSRAEEALRVSEEKHRIVADNSYEWEFWLDPRGAFIYTSPSCERITGFSASQFLPTLPLHLDLAQIAHSGGCPVLVYLLRTPPCLVIGHVCSHPRRGPPPLDDTTGSGYMMEVDKPCEDLRPARLTQGGEGNSYGPRTGCADTGEPGRSGEVEPARVINKAFSSGA